MLKEKNESFNLKISLLSKQFSVRLADDITLCTPWNRQSRKYSRLSKSNKKNLVRIFPISSQFDMH